MTKQKLAQKRAGQTRRLAMFAKKKEGQRFMILISSGTCDATKVHVAVTNGFAQLKGDATTKVDFVLMAEGGWVVEDKVLRSIGAFGLPPMSKLLDDPCMQDPYRVTWTV